MRHITSVRDASNVANPPHRRALNRQRPHRLEETHAEDTAAHRNLGRNLHQNPEDHQEPQARQTPSHARFRDHDGKVRAVTATGITKTAARTTLLTKLQNRAKTNHTGELTTNHKINHLLDLWERRFEGLVADGTRSPTSLDTYRRALNNHVRPAIGELHIGEATTPRLDHVLADIKHHAGEPTARTCRAVISGAMKLAVRYGALTVNPVREVDAIETKPKNPPRAVTPDEVTLLRKGLTPD